MKKILIASLCLITLTATAGNFTFENRTNGAEIKISRIDCAPNGKEDCKDTVKVVILENGIEETLIKEADSVDLIKAVQHMGFVLKGRENGYFDRVGIAPYSATKVVIESLFDYRFLFLVLPFAVVSDTVVLPVNAVNAVKAMVPLSVKARKMYKSLMLNKNYKKNKAKIKDEKYLQVKGILECIRDHKNAEYSIITVWDYDCTK
jgi:hypothetical protein